MATAVQTSTPPGTPNPRARLALASVLGALFVVAGLVVAVYLIPMVWTEYVSPVLRPLGAGVDLALRLIVQIVAAGVIIWLGTRLAGDNPPRGLRGGIFLVVSVLITVFFLTRAVGIKLEESGFGQPVTLAVLGALLAASFFFLRSARAERLMLTIEEQGWLSAHRYKPKQGIRMRRYTLIGILIVGGTGVYSVFRQQTFGTGDWTLRIPYTGDPSFVLTVLPSIQITIVVLLAALTLWIGIRIVNIPTFADFLIATEAEMNKVSWSSRKRLVQDTIVVLITVLILTLFLLLVDLFWGWLLSQSWIGVLPERNQTAAPVDPTQGKRVDW